MELMANSGSCCCGTVLNLRNERTGEILTAQQFRDKLEDIYQRYFSLFSMNSCWYSKKWGSLSLWIIYVNVTRDVLCCVVLYCIVLCCYVLCCIVLCCVVMCCVALCCYVLCCVVLLCIVLCCVVLRCVVLILGLHFLKIVN